MLDLNFLTPSSTLNIIVVVIAIAVFSFALALRALRNRLKTPDLDEGIEERLVLEIKVPKFNEQGPVAAGIMFSALHGLLEKEGANVHVSFEIAADSQGVKFYTVVPPFFEKFVKSQIYAQYPEAEINVVEDYASNFSPATDAVAATELSISKPYFFPIKTFPDFEVDPLAAITSAVDERIGTQRAWIQLLIRPVDDTWQKIGYEYISAVKTGTEFEQGGENEFVAIFKQLGKEFLTVLVSIPVSIFTGGIADPAASKDKEKKKKEIVLTAGEETAIKSIENKLAKLGFESCVRIVGIGANQAEADQQIGALTSALKQFSAANLNSFVRKDATDGLKSIEQYQKRILVPSKSDPLILDTEELASLFHLPNVSVATPNIAWTKAKKAEYPLDLPVNVEPALGVTTFRNERIKFGIKRDDRRRHMYIIGKTGTGKSTMMQNMAISDIYNGEGLAFIDPHGDSIDLLLEHIPDHRMEDVVLFDPSDLNYPLAINMLELFDPEQKGLVASGLIEVFRKRFEFSWGPRLEHLLRHLILSLLEIPGSTLLGITRMLTDLTYRRYIVHLLEDPVMIDFWNNEYPQLEDSRSGGEAIAPIQNRIGQFLASPIIRNLVSNARSTVQFDEIMNQQKIFLVNLSKGKIGDDNSNILGSLIVSRLQFAAMARVKIPEKERKDFYLYVDEFQNFISSSFATILSEARKYRLCLIMAHQYIGQLEQSGLSNSAEVREAVFGNVGSMLAFTIGQSDAEVLAKEFAGIFDESDFVTLERFNMYLKLMIDLTQSRPFSAGSLPIDEGLRTNNKEKVIELSRKKYGVPKQLVEKRISDWSAKVFAPGMDDDIVSRLRLQRQSQADKARMDNVNQLNIETNATQENVVTSPEEVFIEEKQDEQHT
ncbi:ATP-binding protein [candidate division WWE3 bacterium]|uniref:ATP-binding protein n=1 Tax=candidate division WWE3 bacterium TaxID=2053526 RepID=A0A955LHD1_UNCKA|nr:ATP-binding protein [candidate division WWE3 bacterium]